MFNMYDYNNPYMQQFPQMTQMQQITDGRNGRYVR